MFLVLAMDLLGNYSSDEQDDDAIEHATDRPIKERTLPGRVRLVTSCTEDDLFIRKVPHTPGNWASHVFVKVSLCHVGSARKSVARFCSRLENAGWTGTVLSHEANLHLSLSRPFFLQLSSIESFVRSLKKSLMHEHSTKLLVTGETLLVNDERTRSFWCWKLTENPSITRILKHVDKVLTDYKQDPYYEAPEFHVSLASLAGNVQDLFPSQRHANEADRVASADSADEEEDADSNVPLILSVDHVYCTFGTTKTYRIDLDP